MASSVSEVVKDVVQKHAASIPENVSTEQQKKWLQEVTLMQGSIWEYSDSQPWFLVGLHKNNPTATRQVLESLIHFHPPPTHDNDNPFHEKRRGTLTITDGGDTVSLIDSQGHRIHSPLGTEGEEKGLAQDAKLHVQSEGIGNGRRIPLTVAEELLTDHKRFSGSPETKIVITKTVELIGDMNKSSELVFHAVRACARFLTYPTPSVPSDNFVFGHIKGWIWLIYKGLSHFSYEKTDKRRLDLHTKTFRREMSLLAREVNSCVSELHVCIADLKKLNGTIRKEAKLIKSKQKSVWQGKMDRYFIFVDDMKAKSQLLVDVEEDRFFPTGWIFEPHPSQTKLEWDFFHFQWVDLKRDWMDCDFEVRSDYSLHWKPYTSFAPEFQVEIIVHLIQHVKALIEECRRFHKANFHLSFDSQEIKFLKFAVQEINKLKNRHENVGFIAGITKKLFEDLALLEKVAHEYAKSMDWILTIIEPCYYTMNTWLADDLILPLEFPVRRKTQRQWSLCGGCSQRKLDFLQLFGEPLEVVLLRSPISIEQQERLFPPAGCLSEEVNLPSSAINSYGISEGYTSSIFDAGLGRDAPLPLHHPLPKYKRRREQTYNMFDIRRLIESSVDCLITTSPESSASEYLAVSEGEIDADVDIEKYLALMGEVQRFLALFSTIFNFMMVDLKERMEMVESLIYNNLPENYDTLENMLSYETGKREEAFESSGAKAFGRLSKIFQFVVLFLEKVDPLEDTDMTYYSSKLAYYKSYAKFHSWIYQKAILFSMYNLPSKQDMFASLFLETDGADTDKCIGEFVEHGHRLIDICESNFKKYNIQ